MTRDETRAAIAVMTAWCDGKKIEERTPDGTNSSWVYEETPSWDWQRCTYRIAPEPRLRPWKLEEVPVGGIVKKCSDALDPIKTQRDSIVSSRISEKGHVVVRLGCGDWIASSCLLVEWTMDDGSPCGSINNG